jgi:hypothetical protein
MIQDARNLISLRDKAYASLNGATAVGLGDVKEFPATANVISCQVSFTGAPSAVKVILRGTIDTINWFLLATFDTGSSGASGDIISSTGVAVIAALAELVTLTGGANPTVSAFILANRGG